MLQDGCASFETRPLFLRSRRGRRLEEALLRMRIDLHGIEKNSSF